MHPILFEIPRIEFLNWVIGPIPIRLYGLMIGLGFLLGIYLAARQAKKEGVNPDRVLDLGVYMLLTAIVGSRLLFVLTNLQEFADKPAGGLRALERRTCVLRRAACGRARRHLVRAEARPPGLEDRRHHGAFDRARPGLRQAGLFLCRLLLRRALQRPGLHHLQRSPFSGTLERAALPHPVDGIRGQSPHLRSAAPASSYEEVRRPAVLALCAAVRRHAFHPSSSSGAMRCGDCTSAVSSPRPRSLRSACSSLCS